ncbi:MAG TPA: tetratricopeptide repeat protein [Steroidobacteraceae bacterium]|nr:tetratricopeptide repeat protein [Steroidobacteraceae bacterium]
MQWYGLKDVERMLRLSRGTIRGLVARGFIAPTRGPRRELRFSFQDLILLRAARALAQAKVPSRRISRSLTELRRKLPDSLPLSGLNICAIGERVVVRRGNRHWNAESGQYLLALDVSLEEGSLRILEVSPTPAPQPPSRLEGGTAESWFDHALGIEEADPAAAIEAYRRCCELDATHTAAQVNLGRLLHAGGELAEAERVYRTALSRAEPSALLLFNFGVLLEDSGRRQEALEHYLRAITADPDLADAHFNLARLYELQGKPQHAIRHLGCYRKLTQP